MLVLRCPLTAFVTYKSKKEVATKVKKIRERQERQAKEINNALVKRSIRRRLQSDEDEAVI
jgi:hypothetical protein